MLSKAFRLDRKAFDDLKRSSEKAQTKHFHVYFQENVDHRFGVVVSKKICSKAVQRNTLRRQVYAIIRTLMDQHSIQSGIAAIFYAKKSAADADFSALHDDIAAFFTRF